MKQIVGAVSQRHTNRRLRLTPPRGAFRELQQVSPMQEQLVDRPGKREVTSDEGRVAIRNVDAQQLLTRQ